jgi:uncharacterized membrane protein YjjB (DUF3815 family)
VELLTILTNSLWAALFATGYGILLNTPPRFLVSCFACGFMGRAIRDVCMGWGLDQNWSTAAAVAVIVLLAAAIVRRRAVSPGVLICAILPLGSSVAMFSMIFDLLRVSSLNEEALVAAAVSLSANAGKAFTGTLAIALGLGAGMAIVRLVKRETLGEV